MFEVDSYIEKEEKRIEKLESDIGAKKWEIFKEFSKSFSTYWHILTKYDKKGHINFRGKKITSIKTTLEFGAGSKYSMKSVVRGFLISKKKQRINKIIVSSSSFILFAFLGSIFSGILSKIFLMAFLLSIVYFLIIILFHIVELDSMYDVITIEDFVEKYGISGLHELNELAKEKAMNVLPSTDKLIEKIDLLDAEKDLCEFI